MWTSFAINLLIEAYEEYRHMEHVAYSRRQMWMNIEEYLSHKDIMFTVVQIKTKWRNLIKLYKSAKDRMRSSGEAHSSFQYYNKMDAIFGDRPTESGNQVADLCLETDSQNFSYEWLNSTENVPPFEDAALIMDDTDILSTSSGLNGLGLENTENVNPNENINPIEPIRPGRRTNYRGRRNIDKLLSFRVSERKIVNKRHKELVKAINDHTCSQKGVADSLNNIASAISQFGNNIANILRNNSNN